MEEKKRYWNRLLAALEPYTPGRQPRVVPATIKLNTNENPYPPSPRALEAIRAATADSLRLYPRPYWDELRAALSHAYGIAAERIFCANGSDELLSLAIRCFAEPVGRVLTADPTYSLYETLCAFAGVTLDRMSCDGDFRIHLADWPAEGYGLALLANPNAPTGIIVSLEEIERYANRFAGVLLVDEAYIDFSADPQHASALTLLERCPNLLVTRTYSKSFSLCGLRAGYGFASTDLIDGLLAGKDSYNLDALAQAGARGAVEDIAWMQANARKIVATRAAAADRFAGLGFRALPSQANFLFVSHPDHEARTIQQALEALDIHVRHFGAPRLADWLRVSIGTDEEMERFFMALVNILQGMDIPR